MDRPRPSEAPPPADAAFRRDFPAARAGWIAVVVLALIGCVAFVDRQVLALLVEPLKADLHVSDTQIGLLQGFSFVVLYATAGVPLGFAVDRYSRRLIIFLGVIAWSVATVVSGLARTFDELLLARICVGLGEAALGPAAYSMLSDLFPKNRLGLALSIFNMGLLFGSITALVVSGQVISAAARGLVFPLIGWRNVWQSTFLVIGAPGCLFSLLVFVFPEPRRRRESMAKVTIRNLFAFMRSRGRFLVFHFAGFSLLMAVSYGAGAWSPVALQRVYGWSITQVSLGLAALYAVAGMSGQIINGRSVDVLFTRGVEDAHLRYYSVASLAIAAAGLVSVFARSGVVYIAVFVPLMVFINFGGVAAAAIQIVTPGEMRGRMSSVYLLVVNIIGVSFGPAGAAWLTEALFHDPKKIGSGLGLFVTVAAAVAAVLFRLGLKPMRQAVQTATR